jgi:hypothetical protein
VYIFDEHYFGKWVGHGVLMPGPPRSPDFTPMDFSLWNFVKSVVCVSLVLNRAEAMRIPITRAINQVDAAVLKRISDHTYSNCKKNMRMCPDISYIVHIPVFIKTKAEHF